MAAPRSPLALATFEVGWRTRSTIRRIEQEATPEEGESTGSFSDRDGSPRT